ncbi:Rcs stress response system protein RcsF [Ferrimonas lipolytica]|uniref:RcsF protein n=1 Tax=Ferrimonas lipolytica TaxID=2724191 RepID=A0A6H1UGC4_9GAMM|nr:Rcs stress response system protein RcsF [Ferrimonas lipolytica]QIZ77373.1 hypothetical protein HER31_11070 [Ferrimonas lipolytica]
MHRTLAFALLLLGGCSNTYDFSSNLDPEPIKDYFSTGSVAIYDAMPANAERLAFIDGSSCQTDVSLPPASEVEARTELRHTAAQLGANGVVLSQCVALEELPGCVTNILCSGQAIKIKQ